MFRCWSGEMPWLVLWASNNDTRWLMYRWWTSLTSSSVGSTTRATSSGLPTTDTHQHTTVMSSDHTTHSSTTQQHGFNYVGVWCSSSIRKHDYTMFCAHNDRLTMHQFTFIVLSQFQTYSLMHQTKLIHCRLFSTRYIKYLDTIDFAICGPAAEAVDIRSSISLMRLHSITWL